MAPSIFIILLGCNVFTVLLNRIETAYSIINNSAQHNIHVFLSGGKKNDLAKETEAQIMRTHFENHGQNNTDLVNLEYVLDEASVNTAENFMRATMHLNSTDKSYDKFYVVTSAFHHNRARTMLGLIDPSREYEWVLGQEALPDAEYWENIHIKNVYADVERARMIM